MQATLNLLDVVRGRRKTLKKQGETKNDKKSNRNKYFFTFIFLYIKKSYFVTKHICHISVTVFSSSRLLEM